LSISKGKSEEPLPAELGEVIGGYRLDSVLGLGGMGCVYVGVHARLGRKAAIKVLRASLAADAAYVARFFDEARAVNAIRHPNIIDIFDFIETESPLRVACIMELVSGPTLRKCLADAPFTLPQATNVGLQLVSALDAVHSVGVVHRDLKPDNVLVCGSIDGNLSEVPSIKVLDFGIAKVRLSGDAGRTTPGLVLGTPAYMSPEQIGGQETSAASDIYSLGILYYEAIAGRRLFSGDPTAILRRKLLGEISDLVLPPGTPAEPEIRELVAACLRSEPRDRPTLSEIRTSLETILVISDEAREETRLSQAPPARPSLRAQLPPFVAPGSQKPSRAPEFGDLPETKVAEAPRVSSHAAPSPTPARPQRSEERIPVATPRPRVKSAPEPAAAFAEPMGAAPLDGPPSVRTPVHEPSVAVFLPRTAKGMTPLIIGAALLVLLSVMFYAATRESPRIEILPEHEPPQAAAVPERAAPAAPTPSATPAAPTPSATPAAPASAASALKPPPSTSPTAPSPSATPAAPTPSATPATPATPASAASALKPPPSASPTAPSPKPRRPRPAPLPKEDIAPW